MRVVVSPHFDDAVLSCWTLLGEGVTVVTVFTGGPNRPGFLSGWDADSGAADSDERIRQRIAENNAALAVAGATPLNFGAVEAQYDGGGTPLSLLAEHIADADEVWLPAGVGAEYVNPEHIVVRDACLLIRPDASLYADQPYSQFQPAESFTSREPAPPGTPQTIELSDAQRAAKQQALECYAGEMPKLKQFFGPFLNAERLAYELFWR